MSSYLVKPIILWSILQSYYNQFSFTYLTLIGMRVGIFHPLSFLDQNLSADFLIKSSKLFWRWKLTSIGLFWPLPSSLSIIKITLGGAKDEHFSCFHSSCHLGLRKNNIKYLKKITRVVMKSAMEQASIFFCHCFSVESRFDIQLTFFI